MLAEHATTSPSIRDLDQPISLAGRYDDHRVLLLIFTLDEDRQKPGEDFHVLLYQKKAAQWLQKKINTVAGLSTTPRMGSAEFGTIESVERVASYFLIRTHLNPSAGATFFLDDNLRTKLAFWGWPAYVAPDGTLLLHHSQVHFSSYHPVELSVYNPSSNRLRQVFPEQPVQPLHRSYLDKVAKAYKERGERWFADHNHPGLPTSADSAISSKVKVAFTGRRGALAFAIDFDNHDWQPLDASGEPLLPSGVSPATTAIYVYRNVWDLRMKVQEISPETFHSEYVGNDLLVIFSVRENKSGRSAIIPP